MKIIKSERGFTLIEAIVSTAVFALFAIGIYGSFQAVLKAVYKSRINIIETALLDEQLEIARNLSFDDIGLVNGVPSGVIPRVATITRNGVEFLVTTVIRSIDDPFDGVLGGTPNDTAPADYKLVEITARCTSCEHPTENTISTIIPPKDLEGSTNNGAIFIYVTDSNNNPLPGANVSVTNTSTIPNVIIDEVTDSNGYLKIVDTPTGTMSYNINVSLPGYSSDYTTASSTENPDPIRYPLTVSPQQITESFFSIDRLGSMGIHTVDESCDPVGNANFNLSGEKLIGRPNLKKYSQNLQTDAGGNLDVVDLEFDNYTFGFSGSYDVAGSLPILPTNLVAGSHKDITLVLATHSNNSLLVKVLDNANDLPVADATVSLTRDGHTISQKTNYGNFSQTDWSGGSGTELFSEEFPNKFYNSFNLDTDSLPGNISLAQFSGQYFASGYLESSVIDLGKKMDLLNVLFTTEALPPEAGENSVLIQLATSNSSSLSSLQNFIGPDGTPASFYSATSTIAFTGGQGYRYFRYKIYISTENQAFAPIFSGFSLTFTNGCTPPGQVFFKNLEHEDYLLSVSAAGFDTVSTTIDVDDQTSSTVKLYQSL